LLFRHVLVVSGLLVSAAPFRAAEACGPSFPAELLHDRPRTLGELPDGAFALEVQLLVPKPSEGFVLQEGPEPEGAREGGGERETALYQAGAQAFRQGRHAEARSHFAAVLALPGPERKHFSTFAAYMLGRLATQHEEARKRFGEVRALAQQGFEDPLGLAIASLGEEARVLARSGDDAGAVRLYAQQAAHGSWGAASSLLFMSRTLAVDASRRERALADPVVQRLLSLYAWTHPGDGWEREGTWQMPAPALLESLAALPSLAGADRLAAAAWRAGRFDVAERFASREHTPLATWVQAKLAVRRGDPVRAAALLEEASAAVGKSGVPAIFGEVTTAQRLESEQAILALAREDFGAAMDHALRSCLWRDIAYVAERVLTVEELERLVKARASQPPPPLCGPRGEPDADHWARWSTGNVDAQLRILLARRLLRVGRGQDALHSFPQGEQAELARRYQETLERTAQASDPVDRAAALHQAALLTRQHGMELLGAEDAPDWAWTEGEYSPLERSDDDGAEGEAGLALPRAISERERQRVKAHAPPHLRRFHYRSTAADLEEQAAALVPPRSQAYAVLLCHAALFTWHSEPERVTRLWKTYVKRGALLSEDWEFGQRCPEPAFERARDMLRADHVKTSRQRSLMTGALAVPLAGLALVSVWRRRRVRGSPLEPS
jgi:hypothetical protein